MSRQSRIRTAEQPRGAERPGEQFLISLTGIEVRLEGRPLVMLALGIATALGAVVKLSLF